MVQTAPSAQDQVSDQNCNQPLSPEQVARIQEVCQELKMKSLNLVDFKPKSYDFLIEFTPESKQPWGGHYTALLQALESEVDGYVDFFTPDVYKKTTKRETQDAIIIQRIYPNG